MKKTLLLIALSTAAFIHIQAQYVTIPDVDLRNHLKTLYPSCFNANDKMDTTCSGIVNARSLNLYSKNIHYLEGIEYFDQLDSLDCAFNILSYINKLPPALSYLKTSFNAFVLPLPKLPSTLKTLVCRNNQFTSLPTLPTGLTSLDCYNNSLTMLPTLPNSLLYLDCSYCGLTTLPALPSSLEYLECSYNNLTSLPTLPTFLTNLTCVLNRLTSLPTLPSVQLVVVKAGDNCFTTFPTNPGIFIFTVSPNRLDCTTAIDDNTSASSQSSIYPNPSTGEFTITASTDIKDIVVRNILGAAVYQQASLPINQLASFGADLSSGVYILQYQSASGRKYSITIEKQ